MHSQWTGKNRLLLYPGTLLPQAQNLLFDAHLQAQQKRPPQPSSNELLRGALSCAELPVALPLTVW